MLPTDWSEDIDAHEWYFAWHLFIMLRGNVAVLLEMGTHVLFWQCWYGLSWVWPWLLFSDTCFYPKNKINKKNLWREFTIRTKSLFFFHCSVLVVFFSFFFSYDSRAGIEDSKKWGMLFLVNQLFKIYFKVGFKSGKLCFVFHILSQTHPFYMILSVYTLWVKCN